MYFANGKGGCGVFIVTARVQRKKLLGWCCGGAAFLFVLLFGAGWLGHGPAASVMAASRAPDGSSDAARIAYLESFGWTVEPEPVSVEELIIPDEFDDTYADYLALQEQQGFDLMDYRGKRVKRYCYGITNYPSGETGVQAGLLVYQGKIIGGDVLSSQLDGFIHGLSMPDGE